MHVSFNSYVIKDVIQDQPLYTIDGVFIWYATSQELRISCSVALYG